MRTSPYVHLRSIATELNLPISIDNFWNSYTFISSDVVNLWLWQETNKKQMTETIEEAERDASTKNNWVKCCS